MTSAGPCIRVVLLVILAGGCTGAEASRCGDNLCPTDLVCAPELGQCVSPGRLKACDEQPEGSRCEADGVPGLCTSGVCTGGCGDGVVEAEKAEECDGPITASLTCESYGFYTGNLSCDNTCLVDTSECSETCGDNLVNGAEKCDDDIGDTCLVAGYHRGSFACVQCAYDFGTCSVNDFTVLPALSGTYIAAVTGTPSGLVGVGGVGATIHFHNNERVFRPTGVAATLRAVWAFDDNDIYAAGDQGTVLHYNGSTWTAVDTGAPPSFVDTDFTAMWGHSEDHLILVGHRAANFHAVVATFDGQTWTYESAAYSPALASPRLSVTGTGPNNIYITAGRELRHFDGTAWSVVAGMDTSPPVFFPDLTSVSILPNDELWVTGLGVVHHRKADGQWERFIKTGLWQEVLAVAPNDIYITDGSVLEHHNGTTWITLKTAPPLRGLTRVGTSLFFGSEDGIVRFDGTYRESRGTKEDFPTLLRDFTVGPGVTYAAGSGPENLHHFDGAEWTRDEDVPTAEDLFGVAVDGAGTLFVMDAVSLFRKEGANDWTPLALPINTDNEAGKLLTSTGNEIHGASQRTFFKHSSDVLAAVPVAMSGGDDITKVVLYDLSMRSVDDGAAVGSYDGTTGIVFRYNGTTWTDVHRTPGQLRAVWMADDGTIFAAEQSRVIHRFDGTSWTAEEVGLEQWRGLGGSGSNDVIAMGLAPQHFDGTQWSPVELPGITSPSQVIVDGRDLWMLQAGATFRFVRRQAWTCETTELACSDGVDNDCDGLYDIADPDCAP